MTPTDEQIEREALSAMPAWQPIETAPKDGTPVLLFCRREDMTTFQVTGYWDIGSEEFSIPEDWKSTGHDPIYPPTHWMPLPAPPSTEPGPTERMK